MQRRLMGFPCRMSERIIEERRAWWLHGSGNVQGTAHAQGGNTSRFDVPGKQSDGLMADGSYRDEQHSIDVLSQEPLQELRCQFFLDPPCRVDATHKGISVGCQGTDHAFMHQTS